MRLRYQALPSGQAARLRDLARGEGLGEGSFHLPIRRLWLGWASLFALGLGGLALGVLVTGPDLGPRRADALLPWAGLPVLAYGVLALVEALRLWRADLKGFLLLTPTHLLRSTGSHRPLELFRLSGANKLERVEEYNGAKWQGQAFILKFDGGHQVRFVLRRRQDLEAVERTLDLARRAARGEPLPEGALRVLGEFQAQGGGAPSEWLDPASTTWAATLALLIIALVVWGIFR